MAITEVSRRPTHHVNTLDSEALTAFQLLLASCKGQYPDKFLDHYGHVRFASSSPSHERPFFPCPLKEQEAVLAVKALEACAAAAIAGLRHGVERRPIQVDTDKAVCFLMSAYMATIDGMDKGDLAVKDKIPDTDLNQAQSILYRRLSANLYETKEPGKYYHVHGSLDASKTLNMLGLPAFNEKLTGYRECIDTIEAAVKQFTTEELEALNEKERQAGIPVFTKEEFSSTSHGKALEKLPPFTVERFGNMTPPASFNVTASANSQHQLPQSLQGIKVLELCRVIAGPTIGRSLAAHGASVLKVTCSRLPDVPFFQVEVNTGKHTTALDLHNDDDRNVFETLLKDADVIIDGYRPGALARRGYDLDFFSNKAAERGRGFVYVAEDCFGGSGVAGAEWADRPGWQQIADCATGVAWEQGRFMGINEPVVPPFPMSDYGTGALGCVAAMAGLYRRATDGGSWLCRTSLCQYDLFLLSLGLYPADVQGHIRKMHDGDFFALRHNDSVDEVGKRALKSMKSRYPHLFEDHMMQKAWSKGFNAELSWPREVISVGSLRVGHVRASRPNGFDKATWEDWEVDEDAMNG